MNARFIKVLLRNTFQQQITINIWVKKGVLLVKGAKKDFFDPIFSINHTFAMMRANISRLIRKTWNTTKNVESLINHLHIYVWMHNTQRTPLYPLNGDNYVYF